MNMAGKKLSPDAVALRRYLAYVVSTGRKTETWEGLVERFKISKPQLFDVAKQTGGLGETALERFADALFGGSRDALTQAARDWAKAHPGSGETVVVLDALNPKESVRARSSYRHPNVRPVDAIEEHSSREHVGERVGVSEGDDGLHLHLNLTLAAARRHPCRGCLRTQNVRPESKSGVVATHRA